MSDPKVAAEKLAKNKASKSQIREKKRNRRKLITFFRMCRYGVNNFTRNAWLTVAATAVMTITLLVIFVSFMAHNVLQDTVADIRDHVSMSIYLKPDTSDSDASKIQADLKQLSTVTDVSYTTPTQARTDFAEANKNDSATLNAINQATNEFPGTLHVKVKDINNTSELSTFVDTNELVKQDLDPAHAPSFAGSSRSTIETIGRAVDFTQKVGIVLSVVFVVMSMLIIFNTIRMAIFNRREEINMMKLIGAEKSFIRGPFVVEAVVYGFFAALIATGLGFTLVYTAAPALLKVGVNVQPTLDSVTFYMAFVLLGMIAIGAVIGVISSLLATRRHLKL
jgi:cell division transport system permease protein